MRTLIDIPDAMINDLRQMSDALAVSRAELVRRAVAEFLDKQTRQLPTADAFGLWAQKGTHIVDGLTYQQNLRDEWNDGEE